MRIDMVCFTFVTREAKEDLQKGFVLGNTHRAYIWPLIQ